MNEKLYFVAWKKVRREKIELKLVREKRKSNNYGIMNEYAYFSKSLETFHIQPDLPIICPLVFNQFSLFFPALEIDSQIPRNGNKILQHSNYDSVVNFNL